MSITAKKPEDREFQLSPQGTHLGRCYQIIDMGIQDTPFGAKHKIRIGWELPTELMEDGRPFVIGKEYTLSLHADSNLTKDLIAWRGKSFTDEELAGFDVSKVIGAPCMVTVIHGTTKAGKAFAGVAGITSCPKGIQVPTAVNESVIFSLETPDEEAFAKIPEWIQKRVNRVGKKADAPMGEEPPPFDDTDIPF